MDIPNDEDKLNPFECLGDNLFEDRKAEGAPRVARRDWGIPTFEDQIDRGIRTFILSNLHHPFQSISLYLEHRKHSTGSDLWDSALVLAHNLQYLVGSLKGKTVLELGSGTGAVGLYCSRCLDADHVTLTDLPNNLKLLVHNRDINNISEEFVSIVSLDWESDDVPNEVKLGHDLIIGSDLLLPFAKYLIEPLAAKIAQLLSLRGASKCILAYEERFDCSDFAKFAESKGLSINSIQNCVLHPVYQDPGRIHVLIITLQTK